MTSPVEPTDAQLERFAATLPDDGPVVMVNLNRYRERAAYPADSAVDDPDVSGRDAYGRYGEVALRAMGEVGARLVWGAPAPDAGPLIGSDDTDRWDEVLCIWYPSRAAFLQMIEIDWYADSFVHRNAALERAAVFPVAAGDEPVLDLSALLASA